MRPLAYFIIIVGLGGPQLAQATVVEVNSKHNIYGAGLQANGFNCARPHDSMGIGYFHTGLSDDFKNLLSPVRTLHDVDGVELYYNAAISRCFQLTADLQVIEPADIDNDTAIVFGLRGTVGM